MPFAPAVLAECFEECFEDTSGGQATARFMNIAFPVTEWMRERCLGVVHTDGTARPQRVLAGEAPDLHAIISAYHRLTGRPCVVNTSFNLHGEPIVCTPEEAVRTVREGRLDALALGPFLVRFPQVASA